MKLILQYKNVPKQEIAAAFIRGSEVVAWLKTINTFHISLQELSCYIVPASVQTDESAGLFVIFSGKSKIDPAVILEPYTAIGEKLFLPFNTALYPAVTTAELNALLLWQCQFFHPVIGLVGFEEKDRLDFVNLLQNEVEQKTDWSFAHPGLPQRPALTQILVQQPSVQEVMQAFKDAIDTKPLNEIPKTEDDKSSFLEKTLDDLKWVFFKGLFSVTKLVESLVNISGDANANNNTAGKPGLLQGLQQWLMQNITGLEKKRDAELNRLLKLFDKNTDEALKYAIPLDSPYLSRGSGQKSSFLTKRSVNFNLGNLGGGYAVDSWDVGRHYNDLRSKYLKAAQKEIEQKDFRKAAYVYAHLLGDYSAAANVLEQGKFFREAAALHKDHFKNITAAAECLERGGLYYEAIPLFDEVNRFEKVGDLYTVLQQKENADRYYQQVLDIKISNSDYLDAARIAEDKMQQHENAKGILLSGWEAHNQAEQCLHKYFDLVMATDREETSRHVQEIYRQHTPPSKRGMFLNVLNRVNKKSDTATAGGYKELAYEIVSEEAAKGNMLLLHNLKQFLPDDKLIGSDCSMYANHAKIKSINVKADQLLHLDQSIKWINAVTHRNQFIAIGLKNDFLHMARANWYGNIEYYSWANPVKRNTRFTFTSAPFYSKQLFLHSSDGLPVTVKKLLKNKYFNDPVIVHCPISLHKEQGHFIINEKEELCKIEISNNNITIHYYHIYGDLKRSVNCKTQNFEQSYGSVQLSPVTINWKDYFYTYRDKQFIAISEQGTAKAFPFNTIIRTFAASHEFAFLNMVISTNKGCLLCKPHKDDLNIQGDFFATDLIPSAVKFIAEDKFLIVEKRKAVLFYINDTNVALIKEFHTKDIIVSALPSTRNEFGLLEENGRITICKID